MAYFDPDTVQKARQMDLLTYLQNYSPQELVHVSGNIYCTKTHDSLRISNGKWCWFSRGIGGRSALDYLIKVNGFSFLEAMQTITGQAAAKPPVFVCAKKPDKPRTLLMPPASPDNNRAIAYLEKRGIARSLIDHCIQTGCIYESEPHHNVVFIGFDTEGRARFGCQRGTGSARFMGDLNGSDKHYSFCLPAAGSRAVHLFESAIDLLSYATLCEMAGQDWRQLHLLSLSGVYRPRRALEESAVPAALTRFLEGHPAVNVIHLHLDNDPPGRLAARALQTVLPRQYTVLDRPPPDGKDVNDTLCIRLGLSVQPCRMPAPER